MDKQVRKLLRQVESFEGVTVDRRAVHPRIFKDGNFVTSLPGTPSRPSWYKNALAALKRGGIDIHTSDRKEPVVTAMAVEPARVSPITYVPESQFAPPAPVEAVPKTPTDGRKRVGGKPLTSVSEGERLLNKLKSFRKNFKTLAQLTRYVMYFAQSYEGRTYHSFKSCNVSLTNLLGGRTRTPEVWANDLLLAAIAAWEEQSEGFWAEEARVQAELKRFRSAHAASLHKYVEQPSAPKNEAEQVRAQVRKMVAEAQKLYDFQGTKSHPYGRGTHQKLAKVLLSEAQGRGVVLTPMTSEPLAVNDLAKRLSDLTNPKRTGGIREWVAREVDVMLDLWENRTLKDTSTEPLVAPVHTTPVATAPVLEPVSVPARAFEENHFDQFVGLIVGKALTRTQIESAWSLAEQLVLVERAREMFTASLQ